MRKAIYLPAFLLSIGFFYSCSSDEDLIPVNTEITRSINTRAVNVKILLCRLKEIGIRLKGLYNCILQWK